MLTILSTGLPITFTLHLNKGISPCVLNHWLQEQDELVKLSYYANTTFHNVYSQDVYPSYINIRLSCFNSTLPICPTLYLFLATSAATLLVFLFICKPQINVSLP